ncbi:MAG: hypothetical protein KDK07_00245 [Bauldia sp.]|nr:hypothetical protein [Bauldia sp.]
MRDSVFMAREGFARLARRIAEIEGRPAFAEADTLSADALPAGPPAHPAPARHLLSPRRGGAVLPLGVEALDRRLGGGLRRNALHEIRASETRDVSAASGFATALLARLSACDDRPILIIVEEEAAREGGRPYGPGIGQFGLDPGRLIVVATRRAQESLWVFEEGLRCTGLTAVLCEIRGRPRALDLTASRRLALRARENGVMGLLLRQAGGAEPGAAATRWRVAPRPAATTDDFTEGIGRPVWQLDLERNRGGPSGRIDLEWDHGTLRFTVAPGDAAAIPVPDAALSRDRPDLASAPRPIMAYQRTG